jgi:hypothetical protein
MARTLALRPMLAAVLVVAWVARGNVARATPTLCEAAKEKCAGKTAAAILKCYSKSDRSGLLSADLAACIRKAKDKFDGGADPTNGCIAKLEAKYFCLTVSDTQRLETKVDSFTRGIYCETHPAFPSCPPPCQATTGGFCWYIGASGVDCESTCTAAGRLYDPVTKSYAGSDGTDSNCQAVAASFGSAPFAGSQSVAGLGCFLGGSGVVRDMAPTTSAATADGAERFCACQ